MELGRMSGVCYADMPHRMLSMLLEIVQQGAAVGGVLRDHHGQWIIRVNKRLGLCPVFNAELWETLDGLTILHIRIWDKVSIRTDSAKIIQAIQEAFSRSSNSALIRRIQQLLSIMVQWEMIHTPREENIEVDRIAKLAFNRDEGLQLFTEKPVTY
ncbi:hypothetical protein Gogos_003473 [Gossypium gossypioides]|uniref:RNase H type-1 domain-containing protein n=1 Tax=Gossypium gossypioides TaxID=34282 RepID=A0A7J9CM79_GOSGO|nr:hypothetical protein [Gossypium gossypioides]